MGNTDGTVRSNAVIPRFLGQVDALPCVRGGDAGALQRRKLYDDVRVTPGFNTPRYYGSCPQGRGWVRRQPRAFSSRQRVSGEGGCSGE